MYCWKSAGSRSQGRTDERSSPSFPKTRGTASAGKAERAGVTHLLPSSQAWSHDRRFLWELFFLRKPVRVRRSPNEPGHE
jgi:hypothetical protein